MTEIIYRSLSEADVELRETGDGRTLSGILVPWNRPLRINPSLAEEFLPGAFDKQVRALGRIPLARGHMPLGGVPIGRVTTLRNDAAGLYGEARVSATRDGEETLELLRDGVLEHWSIGFREGQNLRGPNGLVRRRTASLFELAVVPEGAYGDLASVGAIRSACPRCGAGEHEGDRVEEQTRARIEEAARVVAGLPILPAAS